MRKISVWAKRHRSEAIACIVAMKLILAVIAFYLGSLLSELNINIPFPAFIITMVVLLTAALLYPSPLRRATLSKKQFYLWQKSCDFAVAACSFAMITTLVNSDGAVTGTPFSFASNVTVSTTPTAEEILASLQYRDKSTLTRHEKRILKEEFKKQIKVYAVAKIKGNNDGAGKALLIALTIIGAVGLLYLVAALACTLACNGSDAAAVIVAILGAAAVIWLTVVIIQRISRGPKKEEASETEK